MDVSSEHYFGLYYQGNIYMFKVSNRSTRKMCEICFKLTIKTPERYHWRCCDVFIGNVENISLLFLVSLLLFLNKQQLAGYENSFKLICDRYNDKVLNSNMHCMKSVRIRSFSCPYFPAFRLNTARYSVSPYFRIESGKIQTRKTPNTHTFYAVTLLSQVVSRKTCKSFIQNRFITRCQYLIGICSAQFVRFAQI